jgi:GDPmannose 4,6-dehydratase
LGKHNKKIFKNSKILNVKKVIVTGVTGQDGSHMVDYLLKNTDYLIYGTARRLSVKNHENILHLENEPRFELLNMDLNDAHSIRDVVIEYKPDYFINFAAQSFVAGSWDYPIQTWVTDSDAVLHILESIRRFAPGCRFYNAGSSEEFGDVVYSPQDEAHPLRPQSPYGAAKCAARHLVRVYRESYGVYAIQGWLFNHEGTRRGLDFVTRKISHGIARIKHSLEQGRKIPILELGNLEAKRDWSNAEDFMSGVWLMLTQDSPCNYILASGEMHSIREFLYGCLDCASLKYSSEGEGAKEILYAVDDMGKKPICKINSKFYRPAEVHKLCGDPSFAEKELGWCRKTDFSGLVRKMYQHDYDLLSGDC